MSSRRGFTLVELMVVMVILMILAGLASYAAVGLVAKARIAAVGSEIQSMAQAVEAFKLKYGIYPPNFEDTAAVQKAWGKMFNYRATEDPSAFKLTPDQALVFWLSGFGPDPTKPISSGLNTATGDDKREKFFSFSQDRLVGTYPKQVYVPYHNDMTQPFAYFDVSRRTPATQNTATTPKMGNRFPYRSDAKDSAGKETYQEQGKFQIMCAGVDNDWGGNANDSPATYYPSGTNIAGGDKDNLTNFSGGAIGDKLP